MTRYLDRLQKIVSQYPDRVALSDSERSLTYGDFEIETGKIYNYLKKQGVKREDHIMVLTKRGIGGISCIYGVLKAGAAYIPLEEDYPKERIDFIKKDASCKIVIDEALYRKIIKTEEYLEGYEETALHDAAFIVYTSGSTGNPKGVVHEYGNIEQLASAVKEKASRREFREGIVAPFYFIMASQLVLQYALQAYTMYIVPSRLVRNFVKFSEYICTNRIQGIFLSPSYLRLYKEPSPYLEEIVTAGEPANGLYYPGGKPAVRNLYGMTEAGFSILETFLDKACEIAPVGKPILKEIDLHLEDNDGNRVEGAGIGEICFKSEYVRGYLNLPEKTKAAFINGVFHTGDIGKRDENGIYYIIGRKDDMFKINGNRVEPVEVESAVKRITGLNTVVARGFDIDGRAFICLYYLRNEAQELNLTEGDSLKIDVSALSDILPRYMIPTYYIPLDKMPLNERGKTVRRLLMPPEIKTWEKDYVPPANDTEKAICDMMAEILGADTVSAESDFYLSGGDSLRTIRLISLAGEYGYSFTAGELYEARTPRKLAKICAERHILGETELQAQELSARQEMRDLLPMQKVWANIDLAHPDVNLGSVVMLYRMKPQTSPEKLKYALDKTLRHYPVFSTRFVRDDNGNLKQVYDESLVTPAVIQDITEAEIEKLQSAPLEKINLFAGGCYRAKIFRTEMTCYLFLQVHHAFTDGTGLSLLRDSIFGYCEDANFRPAPDCYYYLLRQMEAAKNSESYREAEKYYDELYRQKLKIDFGCAKMQPDLDEENTKTVFYVKRDVFPRDYGKTNAFYMTAAAVATAKANGTDRALIYGTHNGRDDNLKLNSAGGFAFNVPAYLIMEDGDTPESLLEKVKAQVEFGSAHASYSRYPDDISSVDGTVLFLYQKDMFGFGKMGKYIEAELPRFAVTEQPWHFFAVSVVDEAENDMLRLCVIYSPNRYSKARVEKFVKYYIEAVDYLSNGQ